VSDLAELILFVALAFAWMSGTLVTALVPLTIRRTAGWEPSRRHRVLALLSVAPATLAGAAFVAVLLPSVLAIAWPRLDHCLVHDDHHLHLCFVHPPMHAASWALSTVVLAATMWVLFRAATALVRFAAALRLVSRLRRSAVVEPRLGVLVLPLTEPLCMLLGIWAPSIVVSQGFLTATTTQELEVALHHERAHLKRRDILVRVLAHAATIFVWKRQRRLVLQALELAAEQSCDEAAARQTGDRLCVAETILRVERLLSRIPNRLAPAAASFGGEAVSHRVAALLDPPATGGSVLRETLAFSVLLLSILAASEHIHHCTESVMALLTHLA